MKRERLFVAESTAFILNTGLTTDKFQREHVKLHLTLMNTRYLEDEIEESTKRKNKRGPAFDASKILQVIDFLAAFLELFYFKSLISINLLCT
jgi:hypothetical protein